MKATEKASRKTESGASHFLSTHLVNCFLSHGVELESSLRRKPWGTSAKIRTLDGAAEISGSGPEFCRCCAARGYGMCPPPTARAVGHVLALLRSLIGFAWLFSISEMRWERWEQLPRFELVSLLWVR